MPDLGKIATAALLSYPEFKTENGIRYKRIGFEQTKNGYTPLYEETDEISDGEAFDILFGGGEA